MVQSSFVTGGGFSGPQTFRKSRGAVFIIPKDLSVLVYGLLQLARKENSSVNRRGKHTAHGARPLRAARRVEPPFTSLILRQNVCEALYGAGRDPARHTPTTWSPQQYLRNAPVNPADTNRPFNICERLGRKVTQLSRERTQRRKLQTFRPPSP